MLASVGRSSGVLKPGEICLILRCPGSGCTAFQKLEAISNQRVHANVSGTVLYAGIAAAGMSKLYKGEAVYNQEGPFDFLPFSGS
jgi:ABC-type multidrug transport system ATPase subunit